MNKQDADEWNKQFKDRYFIVMVKYPESRNAIQYMVAGDNPYYWLKYVMKAPDGRITSYQEISKEEYTLDLMMQHRVEEIQWMAN